jgi:Protein of unknown function (DUF3644)
MSGIEIYNKPAFAYREETFAILALNAWELLLKAKLVAIKDNDLRCLFVYFRKQIASGQQSRKQYIKRNRTGNKMTIGIDGCIAQPASDAFKTAVPSVRDSFAGTTRSIATPA